MAAGTYILDLFDEVKQLIGPLNVLLVEEGLNELSEINDQFVKAGVRQRPYMLINLTQRKISRVACQDQEFDVEENVPILLETYVRGDQRDAILYEGIIKRWFKGQESFLRSRITDAALVVIHPETSSLTVDKEHTNSDGWLVSAQFTVKFNWS